MSKGKKIGLWLVGFLLILTIGLGVYYFKIFNTPKRLFATSINNLYSNVTKQLKKIDVTNNEVFSMDMLVDFQDSNSSIFSRYDYNLKLDFDKNNKKAYGEVAALKKNNKVISANLLADSQNAYVSFPEIFNKSFNVVSTKDIWEALNEINTISNEDYEYLLTFYKNSLINSLKDSDFTTTKDANNKKITLKLSKERLKEIFNTIITDIINDEKAKTLTSKQINEPESKLDDYLKNLVNELEFNDYEISIYTNWLTNNKIIKVIIKANNQEILNFKVNKDNYTIDLSSYSTDFFDETKITKTTINIVIKKESNKYVITISSEGKEYATITLNEYSEEKIDLDYVIKIDAQKEKSEAVNGKFTYNINHNNPNEVNLKSTLTLNYNNDTYTLNIDTTFKNSVSIPNINTKNITTFDALTEDEQSQMQNNLVKNDFFIDIISEFYKSYSKILEEATSKANLLNPDNL